MTELGQGLEGRRQLMPVHSGGVLHSRYIFAWTACTSGAGAKVQWPNLTRTQSETTVSPAPKT
jgi:hypothetical protein